MNNTQVTSNYATLSGKIVSLPQFSHEVYGEKFETVDEFVHRLREYIDYWNNERISLKLKGMSPVQYRTHYQTF